MTLRSPAALLLALSLGMPAPGLAGSSPQPGPATVPASAADLATGPRTERGSADEPLAVAPGLTYRFLRRGEVTDEWRHRVVVGRFRDQWTADEIIERLEQRGHDPGVRYEEGGYVVSVGRFDRRHQALEAARRLEAAGFPPPLPVEVYGQDLTHPAGPWEIHVLEADPHRIRVEVAHATDAAIGLEPTRSLAARRGAVAAVNGGYFRMLGLFRGDATGLLQIDGRMLSETDRGRAVVGFGEAGGRTVTVLGRPDSRAVVSGPEGGELRLDGINRERDDDEVILYTPEFHRSTLTVPGGVEIVVRGGRIEAVRRGAGSALIPADGFVISFGPRRTTDVIAWHPGAEVSVRTDIVPRMEDPRPDWSAVRYAVGGGPLLVWDGEPRRDWHAEAISRPFALARHPRTALGVRDDGTLLLVAVDGRRSRHSVGMSLPELTALLLDLGAVAALNLDGGGSTTMVVRDRVVNRPAAEGGERWNGDALLLFPRARFPGRGEGAAPSPYRRDGPRARVSPQFSPRFVARWRKPP